MMLEDMLDGPIPGENYTSDTKNYPWHRPPEITDLDEAISYTIDTLTEDEDAAFQYMAYLEGGMSIVTVTDIFVTIGIANGKWTPDFALLLAGPASRVFEIMAKFYGIEADLGLNDGRPKPTGVFLKALREGKLAPPSEAADEIRSEMDVEEAPAPSMGGLGAPMPVAPEDEQMSMLGYGDEMGDGMTDEEVQQ